MEQNIISTIEFIYLLEDSLNILVLGERRTLWMYEKLLQGRTYGVHPVRDNRVITTETTHEFKRIGGVPLAILGNVRDQWFFTNRIVIPVMWTKGLLPFEQKSPSIEIIR